MLAPGWGHFWPQGGAIFGPRAITSTILVEVHYVPNIKGLGLLLSDKKSFKVFPYMSLCKFLIELGFNDTSTLVGHFVSSSRKMEKTDRRDSRDEREEQGRKENEWQ